MEIERIDDLHKCGPHLAKCISVNCLESLGWGALFPQRSEVGEGKSHLPDRVAANWLP